MKKIVCYFLLLFFTLSMVAREKEFRVNEYTTSIEPVKIKPTIDGIINENEWEKAQVFTNFWDQWPSDSSMSEYQTEVRVTYDNRFLYLAVKLDDNNSDKIIQTLKRDSEHEFWNSDGFAVIIDPVNTKSNGYIFGINAGGAQFEGLIAAQGNHHSIDANWDNIWYSDISIAESHWDIEMAIPFSSLKYNKNIEWGINFIRNDIKRNLYSTWTRVPMNVQGIDLGYAGSIVFQSLPDAGAEKIVVTPSTLGSIERDNENGLLTTPHGNIGLDSKIAVSSSLNLDLTVNPDFSQVEVDQQITNLSRFNPFFPEKRNFFLENSDLFSNLGSNEARPIFTRKIGIKDDENIPILMGARLSGNVSDNTRVGLMDIQTGQKGDIRAENFAVASVQQNLFKRSGIKTFIVNRQALNNNSFVENDYNRVGGIEFNYVSQDSKMQGRAIYHRSFSPEKYSSSGFYNVDATYNSRKLYSNIHLLQMDRDYIADVGYTPRLYNLDSEKDTSFRIGYKDMFMRHNIMFYPQKGFITRHRMGGYAQLYYNTQNQLTEYDLSIEYFMQFNNRSWLYSRYNFSMVKLPYPTLIIDSDNALPAKRYDYNGFFVRYNSGMNKKLNGSLFGGYGSFFKGTNLTLGASVNYRAQPWGNFSINYQVNRVRLAEPYGGQDLHLLGAKSEISFSKKLFWTIFLQYNTQAENFNINSRIQWRYKPMSDIYFVVTNNYNTIDFSQKDLMFALKLSYWLTI